MSFYKLLTTCMCAVSLIGCGGGGGNPGGTGSSATPGAGTSGTGTSTPVAAASMSLEVLSGAGVSTNSISASEISTVSVVLKNAAGSPVPGTVVTFSESGGSLLTVAPASKTALTDAAGKASVEIRAANISAVGATIISASAQVVAAAVTAQKAIAITSAPSIGVTNPLDLANALNFLDVNPADKSIVLAGSGGNGRSESATLRFRVVDKHNTPVKGATATFGVSPPNAVTLNIPSAISDADGVVVTTVSSKSFATAVVIKATVTHTDGSVVSSQSDQLLVTTGSAAPQGFDLSATKYNLNSNLSGDTSTITVRIVDTNGNPVADGVPVVFTANYGAVGTSTRGGCVTTGGACSVEYKVQDPRPADGEVTTVIASTQLGDGSSLSRSMNFKFVAASLLNVFDSQMGGMVPTFAFSGTCTATLFSAFGGTPAGFPAPANTAVKVTAITPGFTAALRSPSPILDLATQRTSMDFELNAAAIPAGSNACVPSGARPVTAYFDVEFTSPPTVTTRRISVIYPAN